MPSVWTRRWPNKAAADDSGPRRRDGRVVFSANTAQAFHQKEPWLLGVCPGLATMLKAFIGDRASGLVFQNEKAKPLAQPNVSRRSIHPVLESLKVPSAGFHAFRRGPRHAFEQIAWAGIASQVDGHSESNQTEQYVKLFDEVEYRREVADSMDSARL